MIAGRTGIGVSQRAQSFVTRAEDGPYNVIEPGKRPRVTLTPTLALRDGAPFLAFAVQGGDSQDQNLLQFFLNVVEFGMTVQQASEAPNINSFQMRASFGAHESRPGRMLVASSTPDSVRTELQRMGYTLEFQRLTSGPINAISSTGRMERCGAGRVITTRITESRGRAVRTPSAVRSPQSSRTAAKRVFGQMLETGKPPLQVAADAGLLQVGADDQLSQWIDEVWAENPTEAARFASGERKLQGVLVGMVMKKSGGRADPKRVNQLLTERVNSK